MFILFSGAKRFVVMKVENIPLAKRKETHQDDERYFEISRED